MRSADPAPYALPLTPQVLADGLYGAPRNASQAAAAFWRFMSLTSAWRDGGRQAAERHAGEVLMRGGQSWRPGIQYCTGAKLCVQRRHCKCVVSGCRGAHHCRATPPMTPQGATPGALRCATPCWLSRATPRPWSTWRGCCTAAPCTPGPTATPWRCRCGCGRPSGTTRKGRCWRAMHTGRAPAWASQEVGARQVVGSSPCALRHGPLGALPGLGRSRAACK